MLIRTLGLILIIHVFPVCLTAQITHQVAVGINQGLECPTIAGLEQSDLFQVFPNPASQSFTIQGSNLPDAVFTLVDIMGREVLKGDFKGEKVRVDVSGMKRGIYILKMESESGAGKIKISIK